MDDIAETRENIMRSLQFDSGIKVIGSAQSGKEGIKLAKELKPDVIIMDVFMPKVSGVKLLHMMRRSSKFKHTPAMLITGNILETKRIEEDGSLKLANELLTKPFNTRDLIKRVKSLIDSEKKPEQPAREPGKK